MGNAKRGYHQKKKKKKGLELKLIKRRDLGALPSVWPLLQSRETGEETIRVRQVLLLRVGKGGLSRSRGF